MKLGQFQEVIRIVDMSGGKKPDSNLNPNTDGLLPRRVKIQSENPS